MDPSGPLGTKAAQGVVATQRIWILVFMAIASVAFVCLGIYALVKYGYPVFLGDAEAVEAADIPRVKGGLFTLCVAPFLVALLSGYYAKKALRQIREHGTIYSEASE